MLLRGMKSENDKILCGRKRLKPWFSGNGNHTLVVPASRYHTLRVGIRWSDEKPGQKCNKIKKKI